MESQTIELLIIIAMIALPLWAQSNVTSVINKFMRVRVQNGMTGSEVAKYILETEGIYDVEVKMVDGQLSDHYNPANKTVNLSQAVYSNASIASVCVAAHEVGHAIQHEHGYAGLKARNTVYPFAKTGGQLASVSILFGLLSGALGLIYLGIAGLICILAFQLATLPVEYDASARALNKLSSYNLLTSQELSYGNQVLRAAALTYLMAAISTLLNIMRLFMIANRD